MASCDNLYGNSQEWDELHSFLKKRKRTYLKYMTERPLEEWGDVRICYIADIQEWLFENCHLEWVKNRLEENFRIQRFILGKAHHEKEDI